MADSFDQQRGHADGMKQSQLTEISCDSVSEPLLTKDEPSGAAMASSIAHSMEQSIATQAGSTTNGHRHSPQPPCMGAVFCSRLRAFVRYYGLNYVFILLILVGYTCLGASIMVLFEGQILKPVYQKSLQDHVHSMRHEYVRRLMIRFVNNSQHLNYKTLEESQIIKAALYEETKLYETSLGVEFTLPDVRCRHNFVKWSFVNGLIYCAAIYSTIGTQRVVPLTLFGRVFTVIYALLGIPYFFFVLYQFGGLAAKSVIRLSERFNACFWRCLRHKYKRHTLPRNGRSLAFVPRDRSVIAIFVMFVLAWVLTYPLLLMLVDGYTFNNYPLALYRFIKTFATIDMASLDEGQIYPAIACLVGAFVGLCLSFATIWVCTLRGHYLAHVHLNQASQNPIADSMTALVPTSVHISPETFSSAQAKSSRVRWPNDPLVADPSHILQTHHQFMPQSHSNINETIQTDLSFDVARKILMDKDGNVYSVPLHLLNGKSRDDVRLLFQKYQEEGGGDPAVQAAGFNDEQLVQYLDEHVGGVRSPMVPENGKENGKGKS